MPIPKLSGSIAKWQDRRKGITGTSKTTQRRDYFEIQKKADMTNLIRYQQRLEKAKAFHTDPPYSGFGSGLCLDPAYLDPKLSISKQE